MFEDSERAVGPGSRTNALLESYWQPICLAADLPSDGSITGVHILGRQVIVARLSGGGLLCIDEMCPHRGASLKYGFVEDQKIRCPYHGWAFNGQGDCVHQPFEDSPYVGRKQCTRAFPVMERYGLIFVYFGPGNAPKFVGFDVLEPERFRSLARRHAPLRANWLHVQENAADPMHTPYLHGRLSVEHAGSDFTGFSYPLSSFGFQRIEIGLVKTWKYLLNDGEEAFGFGNLLVFPNQLVIETEVHWRVPISSDETRIFIVSLVDPNEENLVGLQEIDFVTTEGEYDLASPFGQDAMALETSSSAKTEMLGRSDYGIHLFRRMVREHYAAIDAGDPIDWVERLRAHSGRYYDLMGGFLPSTGVVRGLVEGAWDEKWSKIEDSEYREYKVKEPVK